MPNVMAVLPNIGGALCSTPQTVADAHYQSACRNDAKTRNPLKLAGVLQTRQQISTVSRPEFAIFVLYGFFYLLSVFYLFFLAYLSRPKLDVHHTFTHGVHALVRIYNAGVKRAAHGSLKIQDAKIAQNSPSGHRRTTLSGHIFANKARIDNRKKRAKQQYLLHMSVQYGELRPASPEKKRPKTSGVKG